MPLGGAKPKPRDQIRHRVPPVHEWREYANVPFEDGPDLEGDLDSWPEQTQRWWHAVSRMPHAVDWTESDWRFAHDTARLVADFHRGDNRVATEIRQRERIIGTTMDARRDLRIRYVADVASPAEGDPSVTAMDEYRKSVS